MRAQQEAGVGMAFGGLGIPEGGFNPFQISIWLDATEVGGRPHYAGNTRLYKP